MFTRQDASHQSIEIDPFHSSLLRSVVFAIASVALVACSGEGTPDDGAGSSGEGGSSGPGPNTGGSSGTGSCGTVTAEGDDQPDNVKFLSGVTVTTLAGSGSAGTTDGNATTAKFSNPVNLLIDADGAIVVADYDTDRLRMVTPAGAVTTLTNQNVFRHPFGLIWSAQGKLFAQTDYDVNGAATGPQAGAIWEINTQTGAATARAPEAGRPRGMVALPGGEIAVSDTERHDIRLFNPGTGELAPLAGQAGCQGFSNGAAGAAKFDRPYGMVALGNGDILVADMMNHRIRRVTMAGEVSDFAGDGVPDMVDGDAGSARFNMPKDLAIDAAGNVYVSDTGNHRIRRIRANGTVETIAGDGTAGHADGNGNKARFYGQEGIDVTPNGKLIYVADGTSGEIEPVPPYHRIRKIALP